MSENAFGCCGQSLDLAPRRQVRTGSRFHLVVDSTGFSIVGEGSASAATASKAPRLRYFATWRATFSRQRIA